MIRHLFAPVPLAAHPQSPNWADGRFRNLVPKPSDVPEPGIRVMWDFFFNKPANTVPARPVPVRTLTRAELDAAPDHSLYRLGHSTVLLKFEGGWWLTDPVFSQRASPFGFFGPRRFHAPPIALQDLPPLRGVLVSHDHYDHLDRTTIRQLADKAEVFVTALGVGDRLRAMGVPEAKLRQLDWWQSTEIGGLRVSAAPAQHFSGRGLGDRNRTLWASWIFEHQELRVFFSGDGGYSPSFAEIGRRYGPFDLTLVECGAYDRHWPDVHMQPEQSVQAHRDLGGRWMLPIHNGTFDLAMHAWDEPFERVSRLAAEQGIALSTPQMGEWLDMDAPHGGEPWWRNLAQVQG